MCACVCLCSLHKYTTAPYYVDFDLRKGEKMIYVSPTRNINVL